MFSNSIPSNPSRKLLLTLFIFWKGLLLSIVYLNPFGASGYDSSTQLLFLLPHRSDHTVNHLVTPANVSSSRVVVALTRWDAIYFTSAAQRGYLHEQEWAFSWGLTSVLRYITATTHKVNPNTSSDLAQPLDLDATSIAKIGILLSHLSHLLSSLVLYQLVLCLHPKRRALAFLCAALHVLSPAGIFLCAPYAEAPFALLSFLGTYCYVAAWKTKNPEDRSDAYSRAEKSTSADQGKLFTWNLNIDGLIFISGVCFGGATLLRSNGLFYGAIFAYDALLWIVDLLQRIRLYPVNLKGLAISGALITVALSYLLGSQAWLIISNKRKFELIYPVVALVLPGSILWLLMPVVRSLQTTLQDDIRTRLPVNIVTIIAAGSCIAIGYAWPQYLAYKQFCIHNEDASNVPWCSELPPSIYTSIQSRYWNVGLFRYWTLSNLPLFLLALPVALTLIWSARLPFIPRIQQIPSAKGLVESTAILRRLAFPQFITALLALTTFHVQIINRISSGYILWYLHIALYILNAQVTDDGKQKFLIKAGVCAMILYACIQATLFSAFLPPA